MINVLDFEFIIIYFLEDALTTEHTTKTVPKEIKAQSKKEKASHRKQRERKEGNHEQ